jgi:hypothetical protein
MDRLPAGETAKTELLLHLFGDLAATMQLLAPKGWPASVCYQLQHPGDGHKLPDIVVAYRRVYGVWPVEVPKQ